MNITFSKQKNKYYLKIKKKTFYFEKEELSNRLPKETNVFKQKKFSIVDFNILEHIFMLSFTLLYITFSYFKTHRSTFILFNFFFCLLLLNLELQL